MKALQHWFDETMKLSEVAVPIAVVFIGCLVVGLTGGVLGLLIVLAVNSTVCN